MAQPRHCITRKTTGTSEPRQHADRCFDDCRDAHVCGSRVQHNRYKALRRQSRADTRHNDRKSNADKRYADFQGFAGLQNEETRAQVRQSTAEAGATTTLIMLPTLICMDLRQAFKMVAYTLAYTVKGEFDDDDHAF
jgi:hypothetical protein